MQVSLALSVGLLPGAGFSVRVRLGLWWWWCGGTIDICGTLAGVHGRKRGRGRGRRRSWTGLERHRGRQLLYYHLVRVLGLPGGFRIGSPPPSSSSLLPLASVSPASAEASSQKRDSRVESTREVGIQSLVCLPTSVVKGTGPGTLCTHSNTQAAPHPPPQSKQAQRARRIFRERSSGGPTY